MAEVYWITEVLLRDKPFPKHFPSTKFFHLADFSIIISPALFLFNLEIMFRSSSSPSSQGVLVGTISTYHRSTGEYTDLLPIYSNQTINVGKAKHCEYYVTGPGISRRHLKIETIIYDRENLDDVPPLVYAECKSVHTTIHWNGFPMDTARRKVLLADGDILNLNGEICLIFNHHNRNAHDTGPGETQSREITLMSCELQITRRKLGSGGNGTVYMAYRRDNGRQMACKVVNIQSIRDRITREKRLNGKLDAMRQEALILKDICHVGANAIHRELIAGGDLFSYIQSNSGASLFMKSVCFVRQILMAVDYLHDHDIVHRDLKPDNILLTERDPHYKDVHRVVLIDFGSATRVQPEEPMSTIVGTVPYRAPELSGGSYTKAIDMWSLGCVTMALLTGQCAPDDSRSWGELLAQEGDEGQHRLEALFQQHSIGGRPKKFIRRLLEPNPATRMTAKQALQDDLFTNLSHKKCFGDLYDKAIKNWTERVPADPIVELSYYGQTGSENESKGPDELEKGWDHLSEIRTGTEDDGVSWCSSDSEVLICHPEPSPTLSDPVLPPMRLGMKNDC
ncbi:serine/threonine-protein kinase [Aspergillus saccharolyticus JOP 1030-1]|uniref:Kinase-like protein n=1 Tax=Aspergillus saccharolyticus JOP 1030-1 TaxID=1450539 RepID=A0A318ZNR3_9EURO|nr:kinase-like protein [Aspergillus saccharolyticus JOP 1030-1]PYH41728.1 kinase-like protein [Aspergillus saccharolyticus JOP 1030-1]